ncbi:pilus assembly protein CpaC [Amorphus sp. MBR-141]
MKQVTDQPGSFAGCRPICIRTPKQASVSRFRRRRPLGRLARAAAAALLVAVAALPFARIGAAQAQSGYTVSLARGTAQQIKLPAGQAATINAPGPLGDIRVADPSVADVAPLTIRSLYLFGKAAGRTTVTLYDPDRIPLGVLQVEVGIDVSDLSQAIRVNFPRAQVNANTVNGRLRLGGTVDNGQTLAGILDLARQYVGSDDLINAIKVEDSQQVLLKVRFVEVNRNAGRELGVNLAVTDSGSTGRGLLTGDLGFGSAGVTSPDAGSSDGSFFFPLTGNSAFATLVARVISGGINVDLFIRALEQNGLGRSLAEPNLVAMSGAKASFLAGGEFPIPVRGTDGEVTVQFREFGVRLTFTPIVLGDGLINLELEPEVSQIDRTVSVDGVPGLTTRRTQTTVELRDGQSFAISGLLQEISEKDQRAIPWIGKVPVLGALFRSQSFAKKQTDLVVIVTPSIVQPAAPGTPLHDPLTSSVPSNDPEFFLTGELETPAEPIAAMARRKGITGPVGYILYPPAR